MNDELNMDKKIRDKFAEFSVDPPPHVWSGIQEQVAVNQKRKRLAYIGWVSAAAVVIFAFMAGWYFNESSENIKPQVVEQKSTPVKGDEQDRDVQDKVVELEENEIAERATGIDKSEEIQDSPSIRNTIVKNVIVEPEKSNIAESVIREKSPGLLERIEGIITFNNGDVKLARHSFTNNESNEIILTEIDELLIAENSRNFEDKKEENKGWIVGAHISPGYSSFSASHDREYAQNMNYSGSNGDGNLGGGFSVQYKTGKRWKVESGVYYSQNGQKAGTSSNVFALNQSSDYLSGPEQINPDETVFANAVSLGSSGIAMNSVAGVVNMRAAPRGAQITAKSEAENNVYNNYLTSNGEFSQMFEILEIPMYLRYLLIDKTIGVELMGGVNAGLIVGNNAYINNEFGKQNIGDISDISTLNLSGTIGVGLNYSIGKHFSLAVEPRFSYFLNSISSNPDVNYKPYRLGMFTGLYYEF